jgi:hypothetical protein
MRGRAHTLGVWILWACTDEIGTNGKINLLKQLAMPQIKVQHHPWALDGAPESLQWCSGPGELGWGFNSPEQMQFDMGVLIGLRLG